MKFTKTLLIFIFICVVLSCSSSDDNSDSNSESSINPPQWILGTWMQEQPTETGLGVRFENDDLILISPTIETSYKDNIEAIEEAGQSVLTENVSTDDSYRLTIDYGAGANSVFEFTKLSDTQIIWVSASSNAVLDKQ